MGQSPCKLQPEELSVFKRLSQAIEIEIPEKTENRKVTNRNWLIVLGLSVLILIPFLIYCLVVSNISLLTKWYDQCGNICGEENTPQQGFSCSGQNFVSKPYIQFDTWAVDADDLIEFKRHCVDECDTFFCFPANITNEQISSFEYCYIHSALRGKNAWKILLGSIVSLGATLGMLCLFRMATAVVVWGILCLMLILGLTYIGWISFLIYTSFEELTIDWLVFYSIFAIVWLDLLLMTLMYKKIQLLIQLLKEATNVIFSMPQMLLVPTITLLIQMIIMVLAVVTTLTMFTSNSLTAINEDFMDYMITPVAVFTIIFNTWMAIWLFQFISGIQHMIIAGAVSKWYFTKNKNNLESPLTMSAVIVFKYHLGTIAVGSMITIIFIMPRYILFKIKNLLTMYGKLIYCDTPLLKIVEISINFLPKYAFIVTAMHGESFCRSGKRAANIVCQKAIDQVVISSVGNLLLFTVHVLILLVTQLSTYGLLRGIHKDFYCTDDSLVDLVAFGAVCLTLAVSLIVSIIFFSSFQTIIGTIFMCFCEDSLLNNCMARPCAVSAG